MVKAMMLASALSFAAAAPAARAESVKTVTTTQTTEHALPAEVVEVHDAHHSSAAGTIAGDAIGGAVLGGAVGGGVALYNRYVDSSKDWGNWQRDIAIGAGIGLAAGLVLGIADAASANSDRVYTGPVADRRESGFGSMTPVYGKRF